MIVKVTESDPLAKDVTAAIRGGDLGALERLLRDHAGLATARIADARGAERSLLHVATDWPGHFPNGPAIIGALAAAGADVNARTLPHPRDPGCTETPLHWAASSNDVAALDALLDAGADIEATGAIFTGGTPMSDAVVFAQWDAARRLLERGASTTIWQAAALGLLDRVQQALAVEPEPSRDEITGAFWNACRGGQQATAECLLGRGADLNWIGWDDQTPLDAATRSGNQEVVNWLRRRGATTTKEQRRGPR